MLQCVSTRFGGNTPKRESCCSVLSGASCAFTCYAALSCMEFPAFLSQSLRHFMSSSNTPSSGNRRRDAPHRLKILHIDPEKAWGGGEAQVSELTTYLHNSGHCSIVAADPQGALFARLVQAGLPVVPLRIRNHFDFLAGLRLRRLVQAGQFDIAHFHTARAHALSPWLQGLGVSRLVTRRMDYPIRPGLLTRLLYLHSVDKIVAISQGVQTALITGRIPAERIRLIPSGVPTARFTRNPLVRERVRAQCGVAAHVPLVVAVGALVAR